MAKKPLSTAKKKPAEPAKPETVKGDSALAARYGRSTKTIYNWRKEGMPCAADPSDATSYVYDPKKTDAWVLARNESGEGDTKAAAVRLALNKEKLRKAKADADQAERENELAEGNVLDRETYELFAAETIQESRDAILRVPTYFSSHLCKKCQGKIEELRSQLETALRSLAKLAEGPTADD